VPISAEPASGWPFVGDSEMSRRMADFDWASSALGPVRTWSMSLRAAVGICLSSRHPMVIWWGPQLVLLYNDAWIPILGPEKHPALGRPGQQVWPEVWHIIGKQLNGVLDTGEATWSDDQLLPAMRFGYLEEAYFTYSYSAIHDETGVVGGAFTAVTETTQRVLSERRLRMLSALSQATGLASTGAGASVETVYAAAMTALSDNRADIPFAAVYLRRPSGHGPGQLAAAMGVVERGLLEPGIELWPDLWSIAAPTVVPVTSGCVRAIAAGASPVGAAPPARALLIPLQGTGHEILAAVLVLGITPYRDFDEQFRGFFDLTAAQISRAVSDVVSYQAERDRARALAQLDRAKSEFFANVSHELRTPLALIAGPSADALHDSHEPLGPVQRERLEIVERNAARLRRLVDDLLDFSQIEAGHRRPECELVDLAAITEDLVASFEPVAVRAGLALDRRIPRLDQPVLVDVGMWEKIVLNLLSNAVKYTMSGRIDVELRESTDQLTLSVSDTGIGIPEDEQSKIFDRFHRVRGRGGRSHEGAGIGLALVAELIGLHTGTVEVKSQENVGSTFTVALPKRSDAGADTATQQREHHPGGYSAYVDEALQWSDRPAREHARRSGEEPANPDASVLVVEDNADMRTFVTKALRAHWHVIEAVDGREGLRLARARRPDLVLTDVMMPRLDGFGLLAALRADPRTASVPVVFLSARAGEEAAVGGLDAGADDYLVKPFSTVELVARVRSNLEMSRFRNREADFRRALIDSMQEGFFVADDQGSLIEANDAFFALTGYGAAETPYRWPYPWVPSPQVDEQDWCINQEAYRACQEAGGGDFTVPFRRVDGRRVWIACSIAKATEPHTRRVLFVGTARDVTVERRARQREAALARFAASLTGHTSSAALLQVACQHLTEELHANRVVAGLWSAPETPPQLFLWPETNISYEQWQRLLSALDESRRQLGASASERLGEAHNTVVYSVPLAGLAAAIAIELGAYRTGTDDPDLFGVLSSHLAQALATARELEQARGVALTLQHAILGPTQLPHGFAVRYSPAVEPLEVGGDWYDVIPLGAAVIGVVVGDCVGRGLAAAAVMGQLRSAARAVLLQTADPARALDNLDSFARTLPDARCTTVFCAVINVGSCSVKYSSAGHPPAALIGEAPEPILLDQAQHLPLAAHVGTHPRPHATAWLPPGSTLMVYTDGLVERRGESLTDGIDRATASARLIRNQHPEAIADRVIADMKPELGYDDDVALLLFRSPPPPLAVTVPATPSSLADVRAELRQWLSAAAIDNGRAHNVLLAAGEAASNTVEHAGGHTDQEVELTVTAQVLANRLRLTIDDDGRWQHSTATINRGYGMHVMRALVDSFDVQHGPNGTSIELEVVL
jgi:PAS domain S-box-containing protein